MLEGPHEQEAVVHDMPRSGERAFDQQHREGRNQPRRQNLLKHGDPELLRRELDGRVQGVVLIFRNLAAQTGRVQFAGHSGQQLLVLLLGRSSLQEPRLALVVLHYLLLRGAEDG